MLSINLNYRRNNKLPEMTIIYFHLHFKPTLYFPRSLTLQLRTASLPNATVEFSMGPVNCGISVVTLAADVVEKCLGPKTDILSRI